MKQVTTLLKEKTTHEVAINTIGNYLNILFSVLYVVIIARFFTPADNGVYIVLFTLVYVFTNIFDFGVSATIYSYLPPMLDDKIKSFSFLKITFVYQTVLSTIALVALCLFIGPINNDWLKLNIPIRYFLWAFGTIPLLIWQNFILNTLYASRKFLIANVLINITNIMRLVLLLLFQYVGMLNLEWLLIIFGPLAPILFIVILLIVHPQVLGQFIKAKLDRNHLNLKYSFIFFVATQLYFIGSRLDLFIIAHFLTKTEVGYYGLAQKIVFSILTTISSITQVLSPQFSVVSTLNQTITLVKKLGIFCILPIGLLIGAIVTPDSIYNLVFSIKYASMPPVVRLLSVVNIFFIIMQVPMLFFLYTIKKPLYILVCNTIMLTVIGIGSYIGTQSYGMFGPPIALMCAYILVIFYAYYYFLKELKSLPNKHKNI